MKSHINRSKQLWEKPWLAYVLPFALFLLLTEPARFFPALNPSLSILPRLSLLGLCFGPGGRGLLQISPLASLFVRY